MRFSIAILFALLAVNAGTARADFVVQVGTGSQMIFQQGGVANIPVFAWNSAPGSPINLTAYDLSFDISASNAIDGNGFGGLFSNFAGDFSMHSYGNGGFVTAAENDPFWQADSNPGHDLVITHSGGSYTVTGTPPSLTAAVVPPPPAQQVHLFTLSFNIDAGAAAGTYAFQFAPGALSGGSPINTLSGTGVPVPFAVGNIGAGFANQFTIVAVPEPSSLMLIGLVMGGIVLKRRPRRDSEFN